MTPFKVTAVVVKRVLSDSVSSMTCSGKTISAWTSFYVFNSRRVPKSIYWLVSATWPCFVTVTQCRAHATGQRLDQPTSSCPALVPPVLGMGSFSEATPSWPAAMQCRPAPSNASRYT